MTTAARFCSFVFLFFCCSVAGAVAQPGNTVQAYNGKGFKAFPFVVDSTDWQYDMSVNLGDPSLKSQFGPLFEQYHIPFDEDSWELFVLMLLEKGTPQLSAVVTNFWDEPVLYFQSGGPANRALILEKVRPLFYDKKLLELLLPALKERLDQ